MESVARQYQPYSHRQPGDCGKSIRPAIGQERRWRLYEGGGRPKEREKYVIRPGDGTLVEVDRGIYLEWYRSERRERYQKERDRKYGLCSIEKLHEKGHFPGQSMCTRDAALETVLGKEYRDKLKSTLQNLPGQDARLIRLLYFEGTTIKQAAQIFDCSRKTIQNRRERILGKIREMLEEI